MSFGVVLPKTVMDHLANRATRSHSVRSNGEGRYVSNQRTSF